MFAVYHVVILFRHHLIWSNCNIKMPAHPFCSPSIPPEGPSDASLTPGQALAEVVGGELALQLSVQKQSQALPLHELTWKKYVCSPAPTFILFCLLQGIV